MENSYQTAPVNDTDKDLLTTLHLIRNEAVGDNRSRELSLVITKIEEALMWYRKDYFIKKTKTDKGEVSKSVKNPEPKADTPVATIPPKE